MPADLLPCPFCGSQPVTRTDAARQIYSVECPKCVSIGFHNHFRFGCMADAQWNERADIMEEKILQLKAEIAAVANTISKTEAT